MAVLSFLDVRSNDAGQSGACKSPGDTDVQVVVHDGEHRNISYLKKTHLQQHHHRYPDSQTTRRICNRTVRKNVSMMPSMRIRQPFAAAFALLLLASAYLGLSTQQIPQYGQSDKGLHFITFFLLTAAFYWILELPRRRLIHLTLLVCTAGLSLGSEIAQAALPNDRSFDPYDILANVVGSGLALGGCSWYHRRMLERRRNSKHYDIVPGDEEDLGDSAGRDVELGEVGSGQQETGVINATTQAGTDVTEELDNWDENEEDWDAEAGGEEQQKTPSGASSEQSDVKKRAE